jgi:hypothetical protein
MNKCINNTLIVPPNSLTKETSRWLSSFLDKTMEALGWERLIKGAFLLKSILE